MRLASKDKLERRNLRDDLIANALAAGKRHVAVPCTCRSETCSHWHVYPEADVQCVSFTREQAERVAEVLNEMEG